jgi:hypothetical protein
MVNLKSTNAKKARNELLALFPQTGGILRGFNIEGECVFITWVRPKNANLKSKMGTYTPTARKGNQVAVSFCAH